MSDIITDAVQWLNTQREAIVSRAVVYLPKAGGEIPVNATIGKTSYVASDAMGVVTNYETRDYIISASAISGEPVDGDRIRETLPRGEVLTATVHPIPGAQCFRYCDSSKTMLRIHTKG